MTAEVRVERPVGVEAEELADRLDGQHLAVGQHRRRAAPAQPVLARDGAHEVVGDAEHRDDERLEIHRAALPRPSPSPRA